MTLSAQEVSQALNERQQSDRVLDQWSGARVSYQQWHRELQDIYSIYAGEWDMIWPDQVRTRSLPKVLNVVQLASEDRARQVAAMRPNILCRPQKEGPVATSQAEKRERIISDWLERSRVYGRATQQWALDGMAGGLMVTRVWHDFTKPPEERFPEFRRLEPAFCYPDPTFTPGPFVDSMIVSYEEKVRTVEKRFGVALDFTKRSEISSEVCHVIEYYDDTQVVFVAQGVKAKGAVTGMSMTMPKETLLAENHGLGITPVVIGTRPTMDGVYRGEFFGVLGVLNFANKLMNLMLDDAVQKVYTETLSYDIENPEDRGPDAHYEAQSKDARMEYLQKPNQPFSNQQFLRDLLGTMRAGALMPPSRSGDPNESIISAAGISASQSQFVEDVKSIQRDQLAPMFQAALEVACKEETIWTPDARKVINAAGPGRYSESYVPSKDIGPYHRAEVRFGLGSGLDEINTNVMVLQQLGAGLIDIETAMEQSPFVEDTQRTMKRKVKYTLQDAQLAGLYAQAQQGLIPSEAIAQIERALDEDDVSLTQAVAGALEQAPLAAPELTAPGALPAAPGLAGAAEGQALPENMPNLTELLGA